MCDDCPPRVVCQHPVPLTGLYGMNRYDSLSAPKKDAFGESQRNVKKSESEEGTVL